MKINNYSNKLFLYLSLYQSNKYENKKLKLKPNQLKLLSPDNLFTFSIKKNK